MGNDHDSKLPSGRLARFTRLATLTARTAGDLALSQARRALGDTEAQASTERQIALRMVETLGTLKGAAMKLGQQLAMEADALPPDVREIVSKLFAQGPAMGFDQVAEMVRAELGAPPDRAFAWFDSQPLASASLGQVHAARLADGTEVAVKVQYPGVAEALESDLKNVRSLLGALNGAGKALAGLDSRPYFEELQREIGAETDYVREASLSRLYAAAVADEPELHVPRVFDSHSTRRVLTLEFVRGTPLKTFADSEASADERWKVSRQLALAIMLPCLRDHMIHGDPHPGNFLVRPDGRLTVLDFGAVKRLSPTFVDGFWRLMDDELDGKVPDFVETLTRAGFTFVGDRAKAVETLREIHEISARPVRNERYDWATCQIVADTRRKFMSGFRDVAEIQAPPESLLFFRAVSGMTSNLKTLRAEGPYRALVLELGRRRDAARATRSSSTVVR